MADDSESAGVQLSVEGKTMLKREMLEWQSQDEFMVHLESESLKNCLVYESVAYKSRDWDNIPPIVPKFIINLQKYMMGVTKELKHQTELETTSQLRHFTEAELNVSEFGSLIRGFSFRQLLIPQKMFMFEYIGS